MARPARIEISSLAGEFSFPFTLTFLPPPCFLLTFCFFFTVDFFVSEVLWFYSERRELFKWGSIQIDQTSGKAGTQKWGREKKQIFDFSTASNPFRELGVGEIKKREKIALKRGVFQSVPDYRLGKEKID